MENRMTMSLRKTVTVATLVLASAAWAGAQSVEDPAPDTGCKYKFGEGAFTWCVSENGNLVRLTSPRDTEHIAVGRVAEGYVVCAADVDPYFDMNVVSSGWQAAVLVEPPTETKVIIERTTGDGRFTLRQAIAGNRRNRSITVRMTLTNNGEDIRNVRLLRSADLDIDGTTEGDVFDVSANAAWAREDNAVTLAALNRGVNHQVRASANRAPRICAPAAVDTPSRGADLAASVRYNLGRMLSGESQVVRIRYQVY